jgi:hypothetical protein
MGRRKRKKRYVSEEGEKRRSMCGEREWEEEEGRKREG